MRQLIPLSLWKQHPLGTQNWSVHGQACVYLSLENPSLLRTGTASKLQICKADHKVLLGHKLNDCEIELTIIFALLSLCILLHFNWIFVFVFCYVCHGSRKFLKIPVSIRSFFFFNTFHSSFFPLTNMGRIWLHNEKQFHVFICNNVRLLSPVLSWKLKSHTNEHVSLSLGGNQFMVPGWLWGWRKVPVLK